VTQNIIKNRYAFSAMPNKIKKELAIVKFDIEEYKKEIDKYREGRPINQRYYDYDLELDFS
jgi:hypothetical protein